MGKQENYLYGLPSHPHLTQVKLSMACDEEEDGVWDDTDDKK